LTLGTQPGLHDRTGKGLPRKAQGSSPLGALLTAGAAVDGIDVGREIDGSQGHLALRVAGGRPLVAAAEDLDLSEMNAWQRSGRR